jgi:hypothetical protein
MKYAVEMGSGVMMYIQSFLNTDLCIRKLIRAATHIDIQKQRHADSMDIA